MSDSTSLCERCLSSDLENLPDKIQNIDDKVQRTRLQEQIKNEKSLRRLAKSGLREENRFLCVCIDPDQEGEDWRKYYTPPLRKDYNPARRLQDYETEYKVCDDCWERNKEKEKFLEHFDTGTRILKENQKSDRDDHTATIKRNAESRRVGGASDVRKL